MKRNILTLFVALFLVGSLFCVLSGSANAGNDEDGLEADFSWSPKYPSVGQMITFDAFPTSHDAPIADYAWDFEDDGEDDEWSRKVNWAYAKQGAYTVELWVKDVNGNTDITRKNIDVKGRGTPSPDPESGFLAFFNFMPLFGYAFGFIIIFLLILLIGILIAVWVYRDAEARGENGALWLIIILVSNIIGLIVWLVVRPEKGEGRTKSKTDIKFCPECGTELDADAKFCKECGKEL